MDGDGQVDCVRQSAPLEAEHRRWMASRHARAAAQMGGQTDGDEDGEPRRESTAAEISAGLAGTSR